LIAIFCEIASRKKISKILKISKNIEKNLISKMGLDNDMIVRTYKDVKEGNPKNPMDDNKDDNISVLHST